MLLKEIMTKDVVYLTPNQKVSDIVKLFAQHDISGAPVQNGDGNLIGICSETDILKTLKTRFSELKMVYSSLPVMGISFVNAPVDKKVKEAFEEVASFTVDKVMTKNVHSLPPTATVSEAVKLMAKHNINRLPVVEGRKVVGIVTRGDIIKAGSLFFGTESTC